MRKPLPSRTKVLELLASEDRAFHAQEIADKLGVARESSQGLLRLLDDLVFDGVVVARDGQKFRMQSPDRAVRSERQPAALPKAAPKGLPTRAERRSTSDEAEARATTRPSARPSAQSSHASHTSARASGRPSSRPSARAEEPAPAPRPHEARLERTPESRELREKRKRGERERREGLLKVNPRGFGFVSSPDATGDDIYIPQDGLGGAMHGDTVVVQILARGSRGAEGSIVEVKARGSQRVSGILRRRGKSAWVELDDPRVKGPVVLTSEIDKAGESGNSGRDGQVVVAEITRFPETQDENPEGKLVAVLGAPGELNVETSKVILVHGIPEVHGPEATAEAEAYGAEVPKEMLEGREDLTHIPLPTIDPEDARDHDDAVWVERTKRGGYEVWVAIADVSSYVRPGTFLDDEARTRGCSVYLPDRAIPMLPRALSSNLCSLLPDVIRLCLCVHAVLDAKGGIEEVRLVRGYMKSAAKLTYGGVARALGMTELPPRDPKAEAMVDGLRVANELSRILRGRRMKRGALDFDLPEAVVKLDAEGSPTSIGKRSGDPGMKKAYQLIEELMIFANEAVARWLLDNELPGVYRVHLPPDPKKLDKLAAMTEMLGIEFDVENTQTPMELAELLKIFAQHPLSNVLNNLLLRSMKQATYDVQNLGHFGLASEAYLHFTSPIRRYPDLVVHRIVHAAAQAQGKDRRRAVAKVGDLEKLTEAAMQSSLAERRAMEVEREIVDIYRCFYMIDHVGERFEGTVTAFVGTGAFVNLGDPFVDVLVRVEDMGADYQIEDDGLMATSARSGNAIRLGDKMMVEVTDVAILRRTVYAKRVRGVDEEQEGEGGRLPRGRFAKTGGRGGVPSRGRSDKRDGKGGRPGDRHGRPGDRHAASGGGFKGKKTKKSKDERRGKKSGKKRR
ncbi:MAG: VacB/RNase II family 3'-5' exoribonuclease [Deltaproteobacteria bacterium]|nr:VacB/RNase II family 3'-5' exoribonuclease [Deltaproteobacteria bacterium]